jgi:E3 ubiquitin-protein ligase HECTD2
LNLLIGLFFFNPDSNYCYFNPFFYESTEIYELVGALFGLAVYNQTSLYAPFPPFLFKKLAAAASIYVSKKTYEPSFWRNTWRPSLADLAELDPDRANFLRNLLHQQEDFESFCWEYPLIKYDIMEVTPICPGGSDKLVTKENREDYVQTAVQFALDTSIEKQFGAFARGFYLLCGGNALALFRGEELELLLRGSDDFDVDTLRAAATYDGWEDLNTEEEVCEEFPVVGYFWEFFVSSSLPQKQRILRFITGTDRLPPAGVANLVICVSRLKVNCIHLPQARTCFNQLQLPDISVEKAEFEALFMQALEYGSDSFGRK